MVIKKDPRLLGSRTIETDPVVSECVEKIREDVGILDVGFTNRLIDLLKTMGFSLWVVNNTVEGNTLVYSNDTVAGRIRAKCPVDQVSRAPFNGLADFVDGGCTLSIDGITISFNTTYLIADIDKPEVGTTIDTSEFKNRLSVMTGQAEYVFEDLLQLFKDEMIVFKTFKTKYSPVVFLVALCGKRIVLFYKD